MKYLGMILLFLALEADCQQLSPVFDSLFRSFVNKGEPGGAVLIAKNNKIVYQNGFGVADINTRQLIDTKTLFNIGSISKTFVAFGILQLAKDGRLSLDDDLYKYFPDFDHVAIAKKVKLYHLLTHTSGLPDSRKVKEQREFYIKAKDEENFAPLKKTDSLQFEPGTRYRYSNPAFNGLAIIIEKITGKKWQEYINETIFQPSGMKSSLITDGPHPETGVSHGYVTNDLKKFEELDYGEEPTFAAAGNGGVWSSVEDLWKYEQAIQQNIFLTSDWIEKARSVYPFNMWYDSMPPRVGLSWVTATDGGVKMVGHTGSQGGFVSDYCWWPDKKIFYVLLCNTPKPIMEIRQKVYQLLEKNK